MAKTRFDFLYKKTYNKSMKKIFFILLILLGILWTNNIVLAQNNDVDTPILLSMMYISKNTNSDGRFVYRNSTDPEKTYSSKAYSSLRHAGTLYSMYLCEKVLGNNGLRQKRYLASDYFIKNYVKKISDDKYVVISKPEEESPMLLATSGGAGLGLSALSNLYPEKKISLEMLRGLGNFIIFMRSENGELWPSYDLTTKKRSNLYGARYYPGEASLGLLHLYEVDANVKWLNASKKGLLRLAQKSVQKQQDEVKFDHWAMIATKKLFETPNNGLTHAEKVALIAFADKNVNSLLNKQQLALSSKDYGSFSGTRTLCGNATNLEGLVAAYDVVEDSILKARILKSVTASVGFLSRYQVKTGVFEGGIPGTSDWKNSDAKYSDKEIRIDNVQHTLSAWVNYKKLLK